MKCVVVGDGAVGEPNHLPAQIEIEIEIDISFVHELQAKHAFSSLTPLTHSQGTMFPLSLTITRRM
jgi:hypothetical protein